LKPEIFAPEIFSTPEHTFSTAFTPNGNEFYFSRFDSVKKIDKIMFMKLINNEWTKPVNCGFNGNYSNNDVRISPNGEYLFFRSQRPLPGSTEKEKSFYIWNIKRQNKKWDEPQPLICGTEYIRTGDLGIAQSGSIYFAYSVDKKSGIYRSKFVKGKYQTPEYVCSKSDSIFYEGDTFVSPDESYIVVTCWDVPENKGDADFYISFKNPDNTWTDLGNLGAPLNSENNENCFTLSPDGKYIFYLSVNVKESQAKTYWVKANIIEKLKP